MSTAPRVSPLDATLGAVVTDVRLADLTDDQWRVVEGAFHTHAVLVFPGQHLTAEEQRAFGRRFGDLEDLGAGDGVTTFTNVRRDGTVRPEDDPVVSMLRGNEGWHTDSSYMPLAAKASMLSAEIVPPEGGETEWADMRHAFDSLPPGARRYLTGRTAAHSLTRAQERAGRAVIPGAYGFTGEGAPRRPLVKVHPVTGRPALFIGRHAHAVDGLSERGSEILLDQLLALACRPPRLYAHRWQSGDVVVWDNRCVLHRARPWDPRHPRRMHHTRIAGDPATETALSIDPDPLETA
jgi:alpha-ketoglutarate-dependent taurine dioxygenase